jgi:diguanylate cyclase (GGDEF)-like protein
MIPPSERTTDRDATTGLVWLKVLHSLQFKASLLIVLTIVLVSVAGIAVTLQGESQALYSNEHARTREWAVSLATGTSDAVVLRDRERLVYVLNDLIRTRRVSYAVFTDASGQVLAARAAHGGLLGHVTRDRGERISIEAVGLPRLLQFPWAELMVMDVLVPVYEKPIIPNTQHGSPRVAGYLRFAEDVTDVHASLESMADTLIRGTIFVLLLVAPCSILAMRRVVAPLQELTRAARALAKGSMDERVPVRGRNEISELAMSFNEMADRLMASQYDLLQLNFELEQRVQERTRELEQLASRDPLTGLYNRRYFSEVISREFAAAERYDSDLTCLMFDLDHFKEINDKLGHQTGDDTLIALATAISSQLRDADVGARFGGDEFVALLPRTSASAAATLADRIVTQFSENASKLFTDIPATLSIGVASLRTTQARNAEALMHEADLALYAAKEAGRNRLVGASDRIAAG